MILDRYTTITIGDGANALVISPTSENDVGIASGSMVLDEKIVDGDLEFGRLISSEFSVQLFDTNQDFQGEPITVDVTEDGVTTRIFTGIIESSKQDWSNTYRDIIAYDWVYYHREDNIASWWNSFWVSTRTQATVKQIRDSLLTYMGFSALSDTYINDSQVIKNEFQQFTNIKFETIFKMLCEIQLTIPHIKGDGSFELITFGTTTTDISGMYEGSNSEWEDFTTQQITGIGIYDTSSNMVQLVGTNTNVLNIAGNLFLLNMLASQLTTIGNNMLTALTNFTFVPASVKMILSDFSLSLGKKVSTDVGNTYVMQNTYSGSLLVEQTIKGVAYSDVLNGNVPSINDDLITANKIAVVQHDIDGLSTEFGRLENNLENNYSTTTEMNSAIEQSAEGIRTEVSQTYVNQTTYNAKVQQLQDEIDGAIESYTGSAVPTLNNYPAEDWTTTTERDKHLGDLYLVNASGGSYAGFYYRFDKSGSTYSWVHIPDNEVQKALADAAEANQKAEAAQTTADGIATNLSNNYSTTQQMNSAINQKADEINQTVSTTYETKSDATSKLNTANTNAQGYATQAKNDANASTDSKLTNYYTKTQTDSAITQKANEITLNVSENYTTKTEFGNLEIGGTNLIRNTHDFKGAYINVPARASIKTDEPIPYVHFVETEVTWNNVKLYPNVPIELINGKTVTISVEVRANEAMGSMVGGIAFAIGGYPNTETQVRSASKGKYYNTDVLSVGQWVKLTYTVDINLNDWSVDSGHTIGEVKFFSLLLYDHAGKSMDFRHPKLEIGNKATAWSPAPEDTEEKIGSRNYFLYFRSDKAAPCSGGGNFRPWPTSGEYALDDYRNTGSFTQFPNLSVPMKSFLGKQLRLSFDAISPNGATAFQVYNRNATPRYSINITTVSPALTTSWQHYSIPLIVTDNGSSGTNENASNKIEFYAPDKMGAKIRNVKLEINEVETDWSYAPEDYANNKEAQDYATTAQTNAVNTAKSYTDAQLQITSSSILSTVEQGYTSKTEFNNLQIGGENLLRDTSGNKSQVITYSTGQTYGVYDYYELIDTTNNLFKENDEIVISFDWEVNVTSGKFRVEAATGNPYNWGTLQKAEGTDGETSNTVTISSSNKSGHVVLYYKISAAVVQSTTLKYFRIRLDNVSATFTISNAKIERGNIATAWSPSPYDMAIGTNLLRYAPKSKAPANYQALQLNLTEKLVKGQTYTLQLWDIDISHTGKQASELNAAVFAGGGNNLLANITGFTNGHADYKVVTFTVSVNPNQPTHLDNLWLNIYNSPPSATGTMNLTIGSWKLEKGNRATEWQMNPIDASSKSEVEQLANKVTVKVNSSGRLVTAELGADPASSTSYVKVKADDIDIIANGNIQLTGKSIGITSTNFSVTPAGVVTCSNITATGGSIGGWTIESDKLSKENTGFESCEFSPTLLKLSDSQQDNVTFITPRLISVSAGWFRNIGCGYETTVSTQALNIDFNGNLDTVGTGLFGGLLTASAGIKTNKINPVSGSEVNVNGALFNTSGFCHFAGALQLGEAASTLNCGIDIYGSGSPYIDFHLNHSSADFTARIVHRASGGTNYVDFIASSSVWIDCRAKSFANQSSKHVKKNIKNITENEAKKILELRPVKFDYKFGGAENQRGLIAEEVNEIMPEMVIGADAEFNKDEPWNTPSIDYSKFVPYLIKMIQIQQKQIDALMDK